MSSAWAYTTTVTLTPLPSETPVGQSVTLSASVTTDSSRSVNYSGSCGSCQVTFRDTTTSPAQKLGSPVNVVNGHASYVIPGYSTAGSHIYTATFNDNGAPVPAPKGVSSPVSTYVRYPTTTTLSSSSTSIRGGNALTLTARVSGSTPTGNVVFWDALTNTSIGSAPVSGGTTGPVVISLTAAGTHNISAVYNADHTDQSTTSSTSGTVGVTVSGLDYFVDSSTNSAASDNGPGTQTQPWRTLARLSQVTLSSNQGIRLKCGAQWREPLTLGGTGGVSVSATGTPIVVSGWGSCTPTSRPVINAAIQLSNNSTTSWVPVPNKPNTYQYQLPAGVTVTQLFSVTNGIVTMQQQARYPKAGYATIAANSQTGTYLTTSAADYTTIASHGVDALAGAAVHMRVSNGYLIDDRKVTSYAAATYGGMGILNFDTAARDLVLAQFGYVLTGMDWMLDTEGEWSVDKNNLLKFWAPGGVNPNTLDVEASVIPSSPIPPNPFPPAAITVNLPNVTLSDVAVRYAAVDGITLYGAAGSTVNNVDVAYSGNNGISVPMSSPTNSGVTVSNSSVAFSRSNGINAGYGVSNLTLTTNTVSDTGSYFEPHDSNCGICVAAGATAGHSITFNTVQRSASKGIDFPNILNTQVANNTVIDACTRLVDCGAIYSWGGETPQENSTPGSSVSNNIVSGAQGDLSGTPWATMAAAPAGPSAGIYLDDFSNNVTVSNNIVGNVGTGINLHNTSQITALNNHFAAVRASCITVANGRVHNKKIDILYPAVGVSITNNDCVAGGQYGMSTISNNTSLVQSLANAVWIENQDQALNLTSSGIYFSGNQYTSLYGPATFHIEDPLGVGTFSVGRQLWAANYSNGDVQGADLTPPLLNTYKVSNPGTSVTVATTTVGSGGALTATGWDTTSPSVNPFTPTSASGCGSPSPCVETTLAMQTTGISNPALTDGSSYLLRFTAQTAPTAPGRVYASVESSCNVGDDYDVKAGYSSVFYALDTNWKTYEIPFTVGNLNGCATGKVRFYTTSTSKAIGIQNVSIVPTPQLPVFGMTADDYRFLPAASNACPDGGGTSPRCSQYVDLHNTPISWPVTGAGVVVWKGSAFYNATSH